MAKDDIYLSVIIITFNDQAQIGKTLEVVVSHLNKQDYKSEILISDGSFNPENAKAIEEIANGFKKDFPEIRYNNNKEGHGKGDQVRLGMGRARGKYKLFMDHDNATRFEQIDKLLEKTEDNDIVIASRYVKGAEIVPGRSPFRTLVSRGGNIVINFVLGLPFKDTRCGFKLYSEKAAEDIFSRILIPHFGFDDEALLIGKKLGYKIVEVPIIWDDIEVQTGVQSHFTLKPILYSFVEMAKIKLNYLSGKYNLKK